MENNFLNENATLLYSIISFLVGCLGFTIGLLIKLLLSYNKRSASKFDKLFAYYDDLNDKINDILKRIEVCQIGEGRDFITVKKDILDIQDETDDIKKKMYTSNDNITIHISTLTNNHNNLRDRVLILEQKIK